MGMPLEVRRIKVVAALARVGLSEVAGRKVSTFSRGMRQRLGLAEVVMKDARAAILDEPTNGLDPQASVDLLELIRSFKAQGVSILLSSHLLDRVQSICDRVALFNEGRIALMGTVSELGRRVLGGGYTVEVGAEGGANLAHRFASFPGIRAVEQPGPGVWRLTCDRDLRAEVAAEAVTAGARLTQLSLDHPSLETIYTRYFQNAQEARHAA
jgi:ABC-2 type transport system ATP-binding protein